MQRRLLSRLDDIAAADWDRLAGHDHPFVRHAFLAGLERHGCLSPRNGWLPRHLLLEDAGRLVAAAPCYVKGNSHGEFVFDHGWANAYWQHGLDYYPKLLCAVPYSPVPGPRLLVGDGPDAAARQQALLDSLRAQVDGNGWSSAHVNFVEPLPHGGAGADWLHRFDWQFHWQDRGWSCFEDFLAALSAKKRKNIRAERAQVAGAGIRMRRVAGHDATPDDVRAMHRFYLTTFADKGNLPVLTVDFLQHLVDTLPEALLFVFAERRGETIAGALFLCSADTLYGRYWGCSEPWPGLHFETCYYQGIEHCLVQGLARFEPGAQGEHKLARGFLPVMTHSLHYIAEPRFRAAIADSLRAEAEVLQHYRDELLRHSPYREPPHAPL